MRRDLMYPIYPRSMSFVERFAVKVRHTIGFCPVCGQLAIMVFWGSNFRETGLCINCRSTCRQRQIAYILCKSLASWKNISISSLSSLRKYSELAIYNTEASGSLHRQLATMPCYVCSEYFGVRHSPGEMVKSVLHEDLANLSFPDNSFDVVLSSDVLEHVPLPYRAHQEVFRVLKPGGRHIFTVPFHLTGYPDEVLAELDGEKLELLKPPIYHQDPLSTKGILVYTIFSLEMLLKLHEIGFRTHMYLLYHPVLGILGPNGIIFEGIKGE